MYFQYFYLFNNRIIYIHFDIKIVIEDDLSLTY